MAEISFPVLVSTANAKEKRLLLAGKQNYKWLQKQIVRGPCSIIQDGGLHVCIFNKNFTRLENYFKIQILVKSCSPRELSINR